MTIEDQLFSELENLQTELATSDLFRRREVRGMELLVLKRKPISIKIHPDKNHKRPHVHVDFGHEHHVISISINDLEVLAGGLPNAYLKIVLGWIEKNKSFLLKIWDGLQASDNVDGFVQKLS